MKKYKFIQLSDIHLSDRYMELPSAELYKLNNMTPTDTFLKAVDRIKKDYSDIDFIIVTGDITSDSTEAVYEYFKRIMDDNFSVPVFYTTGNHDIRQGFMCAIAGKVSDEEYFGISYVDELEIITLDSMHNKKGSGRISSQQIDWLNSLDKNKKERLLIMHHPPCIDEDNEELKYHVENAKELYEALKDKNIIAVFCGHVHKQISYMFGDIPAFTCGSTAFGAEFTIEHMEFNNDLSFNYCSLKDGKITVQKISIPCDQHHKILIRYEDYIE